MFRFSIRELFLATTLAAVGIAWWLDHERLASAPQPPLWVQCEEGKCMAVEDEDGKRFYIREALLDVDENGILRHSYAGRYYLICPHITIPWRSTFSLSSDGSVYAYLSGEGHLPILHGQLQLLEEPRAGRSSVSLREPAMPVDSGGEVVKVSERTPSLRIGALSPILLHTRSRPTPPEGHGLTSGPGQNGLIKS